MTQAGEAFEFALRVYWEDTDTCVLGVWTR